MAGIADENEAVAVEGEAEGGEGVLGAESTADAQPQQAGAAGDGDRTEDQVTELMDDDRVTAELLSRLADQSAPSLDDVANIPDDTPLLQTTEETIISAATSGLKQLEVKVEIGLKQLEIQVEESLASDVPLTTSETDQQPVQLSAAIAHGELALPDDRSHSQQVESIEIHPQEIVPQVESVLELSEKDQLMASDSLKLHGEISSEEALTADSTGKIMPEVDSVAEIVEKESEAGVSEPPAPEIALKVNDDAEIVELLVVGSLSADIQDKEKMVADVEMKISENIETDRSEAIDADSLNEPVKKVSFAKEEVGHKKSSAVKTKEEPAIEEVVVKKTRIQTREIQDTRKESSTISPKKISVQNATIKQVSKKSSKSEEPLLSSESAELPVKKVSTLGADKSSVVAAPQPDLAKVPLEKLEQKISLVSSEPEAELPPLEVMEERKVGVEQQQTAAEVSDSGELPAASQGDEPVVAAESTPTEVEVEATAKNESSYIDITQHKEQITSGYVSLSDHKEPHEATINDTVDPGRNTTTERPATAAPDNSRSRGNYWASHGQKPSYTSSHPPSTGGATGYYNKPSDTSDVAYKSSYHVPSYVGAFDNYVSISHFSHNLWASDHARRSRSRSRHGRLREGRGVERSSPPRQRYLPRSSSQSSVVGAFELHRDRSSSQLPQYDLSRSSSRIFAPTQQLPVQRESVENFVRRINEPLGLTFSSYAPSGYQRYCYSPPSLSSFSSYYSRPETRFSGYYPDYAISSYSSAYKPVSVALGGSRWHPLSGYNLLSRHRAYDSISPMMHRSGFW